MVNGKIKYKQYQLSKLRIINYELRIGLHLIISILQKTNQNLFFNITKLIYNKNNVSIYLQLFLNKKNNFMSQEKKFANDLIDFIYASPSQYQAVRNIKAALLKKGFKKLDRGAIWNLQKGEKYFTSKNSSAIIAFIVGTGKIEDKGFRIVSAHTDSPSLKIKPEPEIVAENSYLKINVETYGGAILSTWLDRPLSIAGRVSLMSKNPLSPIVKYINIKRPILIIPNLAIHLFRDVNDGKKFRKQVDMLPIMSIIKDKFEKDGYLKKLLAKELNVNAEDILDFDLNLYEFEKGLIMGENNEFISSGKIDDLSMVHAGIDALFNSISPEATNVMACFDNEEVGSGTKQGAASPFLKDVLKRITWECSIEKDAFMRAKINSFCISADMAHAVHPNIPEKHCPVARPKINGGPVIKFNANQKYTTDGISAAVFGMLCKKAGVEYQKYANHSDEAGGSTLGSISTSQIDIRTVDVGNPMLAMHSIRELCGVKDHFSMKKVFDEFYK